MVSTTGIAISKHFMMGELFDVSFIGEADSCCPIPCDCCKDTFEFHRLDVEFVGSDIEVSFDEISSIDIAVITSIFDINIDLGYLLNEKEYANNHSPPIISFTPSLTQSFLL